MKTFKNISQILEKEKPLLAKQYHVRNVGIFGSYLHQTQKKNSDLDILVEFSTIPGFFKFLELENYLSSLLQIKVDLVMKDALKPSIGKQILQEVHYV